MSARLWQLFVWLSIVPVVAVTTFGLRAAWDWFAGYPIRARVLVIHYAGKAIHDINVGPLPPGVSAAVRLTAEMKDRAWVEVEYRPLESERQPQMLESRIPLRLRAGSEDIAFELPLILTSAPS